MDEVELVEDDWVDTAPPRTRPAHHPARGPVPWRRYARRWWPVPVVVAAAVTLADLGIGTVEQRAYLAAQELPQVAVAVGPDVRAVELENGTRVAWAGREVAGVYLSSSWDDSGAESLVATDPDSDEQLWEAPVVSDFSNGNAFTTTDCWAESGQIACWSAVAVYDTAGTTTLTRARLFQLDPTTGARHDDTPLPAETAVIGTGDHRITATARDDQRIEVAMRTLDGTVRWQAILDPLRDARDVYSPMRLQVVGDAVVVSSDRGAWALDLVDGHTLTFGSSVGPARQDRLAVEGAAGAQVSGPDGRITALGIARRLQLSVDDGSVPQAEFVLDQPHGELSGLDTTTGEPLWSTDTAFRAETSVILLDDLLIGTVPQGVLALDATTGAERWRADVSPSADFSLQPVTDGRHVLVLGDRDEGTEVVALDLRTGTRMWTAPMPPDLRQLAVDQHRLFAFGDRAAYRLS